jgi:hypothetical protein
VKLLVDGRLTRSTRPNQELRVPSYPAGVTVSNHALLTLSDALRHRRAQVGTRWRRLTVGEQALLVVAHLRKGETYADLAAGFGIGTTTVFRYITEAVEVLAALARPDLARSGRGRGAEGVRDPRRHLAAHRPGRHGIRA